MYHFLAAAILFVLLAPVGCATQPPSDEPRSGRYTRATDAFDALGEALEDWGETLAYSFVIDGERFIMFVDTEAISRGLLVHVDRRGEVALHPPH